jgi:dihydrofolate reductase
VTHEEELVMADLIYTSITSLDGFVADAEGNFDWGNPDEEVHTFVNEWERSAGTYLYGRRMYDVMAIWDSPSFVDGQPQYVRDYAEIWRAADKVVYSRTLAEVTTDRTRIEREFDPDAVRRMKAEAGRDLSIGGPELAAHALRAGLVDEIRLIVAPVVVGTGNPALPPDVRLDLDLQDAGRFTGGMVHLRYRVAT